MPPDSLSSENVLLDNSSDLLNGKELKVSNSIAKRDLVKFVVKLLSVSVSSPDSGVWTRCGNLDPVSFFPYTFNYK